VKIQKPRCNRRTVVAKSRLFTIEELDLLFSNGAKRVYERIQNNNYGAVLIIPVTIDNTLLLVKEYAAGTDAYELGFPKGLIDKDEESLMAANRELQEEVGLAAKTLHFLRSLTLAPGYFGARLDVILAQDLYPSQLEGDEPEPLEIVEWPMHDIDGLLNRSDFTEARSVAALFLCREWFIKNKIGTNPYTLS